MANEDQTPKVSIDEVVTSTGSIQDLILGVDSHNYYDIILKSLPKVFCSWVQLTPDAALVSLVRGASKDGYNLVVNMRFQPYIVDDCANFMCSGTAYKADIKVKP